MGCTALLLLAVGCGSSSYDSNLDAWEREVSIITPAQIGERQYEELGGLLEERVAIQTGFSGEDQAIETAKRKLRRRAADLDADAVVIVECGRHVQSVETASLPSAVPEVICHGVAIRWMD
jgi:hypothetical protein